jgi:hypothetical protein
MKRLALLLVAGCINFDDARSKFCMANPTAVDCAAGGGSPSAGGGAAGAGGGNATGGGTDAMGGGAAVGGGAATGGGAAMGGGAATGGGTSSCSGVDASCKPPPDAGPITVPTYDAGVGNAIYYVKPDGGDSLAGTSPTTAWATIDHAVSTVPANSEIHVCAGAYPIHATISQNVFLRGSYDCATFTRSLSYGWAGPDGGFDRVHTTLLLAPDGGTCDDMFALHVTASPVIDGFVIRGPQNCSGYAYTPWALKIDGAVAPRVSNCEITGGGGTGTTAAIASGAVTIINGAFPELVYNRISGGTGVSPPGGREGSMGIWMDSAPGAPNIHDNVISGGSGVGSAASGSGAASVGVGLFYNEVASFTLAHNWISGGSGIQTTPDAGVGSAGVYVYSSAATQVSITDNFIEGGTGTGHISAAAIFDTNRGKTTIARNGIWGGDPSTSNVGIMSDHSGADPGDITDNMIFAPGIGIRLSGVNNFHIEHNTLVIEDGGVAVDLDQVSPYGVTTGQLTNVFLEENLILGVGNLGPAVRTDANPGFMSIAANAFLTTPQTVILDRAGILYSTVSQLDQTGGGQNDIALSATCTNGVGVDCSGSSGCVGGVITWSLADRGRAALWTRAGWPLAMNTAPCALMKSQNPPNDLMYYPIDFFGNRRVSPTSIGAAEMYCGCR